MSVSRVRLIRASARSAASAATDSVAGVPKPKELPGGLQNRGIIDVSAPLPPHMQQSWNLLGLDTSRFDPIENAPEE